MSTHRTETVGPATLRLEADPGGYWRLYVDIPGVEPLRIGETQGQSHAEGMLESASHALNALVAAVRAED